MKKMQKAGIFFMALAAAGPVLAGPPLSDRQIRRQAEEETKAITERCCGYAYAENPQKSLDLERAAWDVNDCLVEEIRQQVRQAFDEERQGEVMKFVEGIRLNVLGFYGDLYKRNRYCAPDCGLAGQSVNEDELQIILQDMLKSVLLINKQNNNQ